MKLIKPSYTIMSNIDKRNILQNIELAGRTCYKSEDKITEESAEKFIKMLIQKGHESVLEHEKITVKFICDRGVSHEIVRHRIASFSQESTRYCNYSKDKFNNELTFIIPYWFIDKDLADGTIVIKKELQRAYQHWLDLIQYSETIYKALIRMGQLPQQARTVLPNSLKTEIVVTANIREWREIFRQRTSSAAHPQMRELMCPLLDELKILLPIVFDDINYGKNP